MFIPCRYHIVKFVSVLSCVLRAAMVPNCKNHVFWDFLLLFLQQHVPITVICVAPSTIPPFLRASRYIRIPHSNPMNAGVLASIGDIPPILTQVKIVPTDPNIVEVFDLGP